MTEAIIIIILILFAIIAAGTFADILYFIGNPLARFLGLQDPPTPHTLENNFGKVTEVLESRIRVEYQGTTWFAKSLNNTQTFRIGDEIKVVGRDGLTLLVESKK